MLKSLIKISFASLFNTRSKKNKAQGRGAKIGMAILFAFLGVYIMFAMFAMFTGLAELLKGTDDTFAIFTLATIIASAFCIFGSTFTVKSQVFDSKDNELLLSMPIPVKDIFLSRMVALLLTNLAFSSVVMLPAIISYAAFCGFTPTGAVFSALVALLVPTVTLALSVILAWGVSAVEARVKNKALISSLLFIIFFGAYMYAVTTLSSMSEETTAIDVSGLKNTFIFWWMGDACANGSVTSFAYTLIFCAVISVSVYAVLNKTFIKIITTKRAGKKIKYVKKEEKSSSIFGALVKKEAKKFFTSSAYLLNAGMGCIMTLLVAIFGAISASELVGALASIEGGEIILNIIPAIIAGGICIIGGTTVISAPSISLEDKNLWILKSAPIDPKDILLAKVTNHIMISAPCSIISAIVMSIALKLDFLASILVIVTVGVSTVFSAYVGMLFGLHYPRFDVVNEAYAIKQGAAVSISLLGSMLWFLLFTAIGAALSMINTYLALIVMIIPSALISFIIHKYLCSGGVKRFEAIQR